MHSFTAFGSGIAKDVPPYVTVAGHPAEPHGLNVEGMRRRGFDSETIAQLRRAYKLLYRSNLTLKDAVAQMRALAEETPEVGRMLHFLEQSSRGVLRCACGCALPWWRARPRATCSAPASSPRSSAVFPMQASPASPARAWSPLAATRFFRWKNSRCWGSPRYWATCPSCLRYARSYCGVSAMNGPTCSSASLFLFSFWVSFVVCFRRASLS